MFFDSVEQILTQLEQQPGWDKLREHRQLLKCWHNTVSQNTAQHTRPLYINRQVLWVATSSAARAQELSFQRYTLLKKLNNQLPFVLKNVRFSSSQWHQATAQNTINTNLFSISEQQKFKHNPIEYKALNFKSKEDHISSSTDAKLAAIRWLETIKKKSSSFSCCPQCNASTPKEEIERWNSCYHCIAQKWCSEYIPSTFS